MTLPKHLIEKWRRECDELAARRWEKERAAVCRRQPKLVDSKSKKTA